MTRSAIIGFCCFIMLAIATAWGNPQSDSWRFVDPYPTGHNLHAVWAHSATDVYVGGEGGVILHWDGSSWSHMETPTQKTIFSIDGLSGNDIWAVGGDPYSLDHSTRSLVMHYDGTSWSEVTPPDFYGHTYILRGLCMVAEDDVWAVVDYSPALAHWDGSSWQLELIPGGVEGQFYQVYALSPDHLFAVGNYGQVIHRTGGEWTVESKTETGGTTFNLFQSIWGTDLTNLYAGNTWGYVYRRQADGSWTQVEEFEGGLFEGNGINTIWGTAANDIYFFGDRQVRHYTGSGTPSVTDFNSRTSWHLASVADNHAFLIGPSGLVDEWRRTGLGSGVVSPLSCGGYYPNSLSQANGVVALDDHAVLLYGAVFHQGDKSPLVYYDGTVPQVVTNFPPGMQKGSVVYAIDANGPDDITIAWNNFTQAGQGVHRWNGTQWSPVAGLFTATHFWRSPAGVLYAANGVGVYYENEEEAWVQIFDLTQMDPVPEVTALGGRSDSEVYVGFRDGRIFHYDGDDWTAEDTPSLSGENDVNEQTITELIGDSSHVYALGTNGAALVRNGSAWQQMTDVEVRDGDDFLSVAFDGQTIYAIQTTNSRYIGGGLGRIWKISNGQADLVKQGHPNMEQIVALGENRFYCFSSDLKVMTNTMPPSDLHYQRIDASHSGWQGLGGSGLEIDTQSGGTNLPAVTAWSVPYAPTTLFAAPSGVTHANRQWVLLQDRRFYYTVQPTLSSHLVRTTWRDGDLPNTMNLAGLALESYDLSNWQKMDTSSDPLHNRAEIQDATSAGSVWALADDGAVFPTVTPGEPTPTRTPSPTRTQTQTPTVAETGTPTTVPTNTPSFTRTATATASPTMTPLPVETLDDNDDGKVNAEDLTKWLRHIQQGESAVSILFEFAQWWQFETQ